MVVICSYYYQVRIPEMVSQKYQATHHDAMSRLTDMIDQEAQVAKAIKAYQASASGQTTTESHRTLATPEWAGDTVWNWMKRLNLTSISVPDFESGNTYPYCDLSIFYFTPYIWFPLLPKNVHNVSNLIYVRTEALAVVAREPKLHVAFAGGAIWLLNKGTSGVEIGPGELFGFNTGAYMEINSGMYG
jgi:hypothetical protein